MKRLTLLLCCCLLTMLLPSAFAQPYVSAKTGYVFPEMKEARSGMSQEVSIGYKYRSVAGELSLGRYALRIKGTSEDVLPFKYVGEMTSYPLLAVIKLYPLKHWFVGGGVGYIFHDFEENYMGKAHIKGSKVACAVAGFEKNKLSIEVRGLFGDLNLESGHPTIGLLNQDSRENAIQVSIGWIF